MVSSKALFSVCVITDIVLAYPVIQRLSTEDSFSSGGMMHSLETRSPNPRFRNPFDVGQFLENLDYKIPDNKDIQEWVKEARKKGAMAAAGKFSGDDNGDNSGGDDDDDEAGKDEDKDKNGDGEKDDDKEKSKNDDGVKKPTQSAESLDASTSSNSASNTGNNTPPTQTTTVYVPAHALSTPPPDIQNISADESSVSLLPVSTTPTSATTINMPTPATTESPSQNTATSEPEVSDAAVAQEPARGDSTSRIATPSENISPIPGATYFTGLSHFLDQVLPEDQSEASYRA